MNIVFVIMYIADKLRKILQIQKAHFHKRGPTNIALGYTLLFTIFWLAHHYGSRIWPSHVEDKPFFVFIGSVIIHISAQLVSLAIYLPGYLGLSSYYQKYEINKKSIWPWKRQTWPLFLKKTIFNLVLNQLWAYPLMTFCSTSVGIRLRFDNFPSYWELFGQILFIYFCEDFFFYWAHRCAHTFKPLYKLHKIHHQYDKVFSVVTQYFHPIDFALANVLPSAMGFFILGTRAHCFTFFYWIFWKVMISNQGHCGYEFPWSPTRILPLVTGPSYHDHHHSKNVGNYAGSCYFWDIMLETGETYFDELLAKQKQK